MATTEETDQFHMSATDIQSTMGMIKKMIMVSALFVVVGYLLLLFALTQEFSTVSAVFAEDTMKMWLKIGGVGHILIGIFISLVAIIRTLSLMPHRLGSLL